MIVSGIEEKVLDETCVQPTDADLAYDWIGNFVDILPRIRNIHAHGTSMLYPNVLRTFDIVSDLINQLYRSDAPLQSSGESRGSLTDTITKAWATIG
ncbi:hypothetical protein [Aromatoleum evansii]|uniref:hypothetical protein n=1 Tax=Aromatoleum evansii TaxID=59406 RepID=UPI00145E868F|nr:hypothetical protein [Aromatoleum evansii]NMG32402.1 hypothetical protein [Aromatoleum evansii]